MWNVQSCPSSPSTGAPLEPPLAEAAIRTAATTTPPSQVIVSTSTTSILRSAKAVSPWALVISSSALGPWAVRSSTEARSTASNSSGKPRAMASQSRRLKRSYPSRMRSAISTRLRRGSDPFLRLLEGSITVPLVPSMVACLRLAAGGPLQVCRLFARVSVACETAPATHVGRAKCQSTTSSFTVAP